MRDDGANPERRTDPPGRTGDSPERGRNQSGRAADAPGRDGAPSPAELLDDAADHVHERSLTPAEYERLKSAVAELSPLFAHDRSYFVLGSYGRPEIRRLQLVKDRLNRRADAYAFLMVDVRREWTNTYLKFRLVADYADAIVGVAEHDRGGFLVEQGAFVADESYFRKTAVLKRIYDDLSSDDVETDVEVDDPYSGMQTAIFELLDRDGRLHVWATEDELVDRVAAIP